MNRSVRPYAPWIAGLMAIVFLAVWFFAPISGHIARHSAEAKGYTVPDSYEDLEYRYYYQNLGPEQKETYRILVAELPDFPKRIAIPNLSDRELQLVFSAVSYDNPELFFLGYHYSFTKSGALNYFIPKYNMSQSVYRSRLSRMRKAADDFLRNAPKNGSDYQKELYVHDKIVTTTEYKTSELDDVYSAYGMLVDHRANCEGYSRGMHYLLSKLGVVSRVMTGTAQRKDGQRNNHMWNVVTLNGKEYLTDATFDDYNVANNFHADSPKNGASHIYFNLANAQMRVNHTPDDPKDWNNCIHHDQGYFVKTGTCYNSYADASARLSNVIAQNIREGRASVEIQFGNSSAYQDALNGLFRRGEVYRFIDAANTQLMPDQRVSNTHIEYINDAQFRVIRLYFR